MGLNFKKEGSEMLHLEKIFCGVVNFTLRKVDKKYLEALKCGAGEVWIGSVRPIV